SIRSVARGIVARLVAEGARHSHEWTEQKAQLLPAFDQAGLTSLFMEPEHGGQIEGPKNLALALAAFEMAWVDGGAATAGMAGHLALAPIHERGTEEQKKLYMTRACPPKAGEKRKQWRGAFALTEPLPYVGVNTRAMSGRVRVAEWKEGQEPILEVEKRGRFITNMGYADFVSAAVDSGDERIRTSCMIILEEGDEGTYDRGAPTRKLVHQLSSTSDPIFKLKVPASRIIGGYTVKDGVIVPNYEHGEIIAAVFRRTRVTVGLMTAAKLLSAVEPIIRYQRERFRGGMTLAPGTPLHDMGLQQKEDALHRLVDIWATGEASAALGFGTARFFDDFDVLEREINDRFEKEGLRGRAILKALRSKEAEAIELIEMSGMPEASRNKDRYEQLASDRLVEFVVKDAVANVLCPATKLWNTGHGSGMLREAVSLMGGYGITEDCPGFLAQKWMDSQLEATYEGPEAVQRRQLAICMTSPVFLAQMKQWVRELRDIASRKPGTGACTLASAMELWMWSLNHLLGAKDAEGKPLFHDKRQGVTFPMADALCWLVASRQQILDLIELETKGPDNPAVIEALPGTMAFLTDLCHVQVASAAGEVGKTTAALVFGYNAHPSWEPGGASCFDAEMLDSMDGLIPGIAYTARGVGEVREADGSHARKAGPCVRFEGMETYRALRGKLDGCLTGSRLSKDRAAYALTQVMIPEALDYPV
ncbi:MAG TPA: acyl-CoA dehydrogenase family protein, partial [Candidatus Saccharimonadales bacterium]|nr:acyl-CoA dehydrogenase family protein [Candidatus Saccharimonadales bacterium]